MLIPTLPTIAGAVLALAHPWSRRTSAPLVFTAPVDDEVSRLTWVESHPGEVTDGDIAALLEREGLGPHDVALVDATASRLGIKPFTMWMFAKIYGARELAVAVTAEVHHDVLLEHLADGSLPDFEALELFASFNGLSDLSEDRVG